MTPRSDPHTTAAAAQALGEVLDGQREAHVAYTPEHAYGGREHSIDTPDPQCLLCRAEAAEAWVTQLEEALRRIDTAESDRFTNNYGIDQAEDDTSLVQRIARSALGVVADGGGGRDE